LELAEQIGKPWWFVSQSARFPDRSYRWVDLTALIRVLGLGLERQSGHRAVYGPQQ
jgi:hypothetical protein